MTTPETPPLEDHEWQLGDGTTVSERLAAYMHLSRVLVGADELALSLAEWLGVAYFATLIRGAEKAARDPSFTPQYTLADIRDTLARFDEIVASQPGDLEAAVQQQMVAPEGPISTVTKSILALWYCAGLIDLTPPPQGMGFLTMTAPKATYAEALVWKTMGANPMGVPGPYYGNWAYPATVPLRKPTDGDDS